MLIVLRDSGSCRDERNEGYDHSFHFGLLWWQPSRLLLQRTAGETPAATAEVRDRRSR
jgi:hypothetical protein